jgi:outer membrane protein assembly factor BamB
MKPKSGIVVFAILALLLVGILASGGFLRTVKADAQNTLNVQLYNIADGKSSLTSEFTHSSSYAAKLMIPSNAQQGSGCMALYPYNKTLNSLQSFQIYTSYTNSTPRFVILLDTTGDGVADLVLLSDYQFTSKGDWQLNQGGQRWGWTEASPQLSIYGKTWDILSNWKSIYGNATVLSVGVALEYWAVKDSNGLNQPLYADELLLNGVTYNIASPVNPPTNASVASDWPMYRQNLQRSGLSTSAAPTNNLLWQFFTGPSNTASLADRLRASPTIVNGVVYIGSNSSSFYALNAVTGAQIWQVNVGSNVESSAAVVDGVVYVGILWNGHYGYVDALNATNGALIWQFATNSGIESSPAVVNGVIYIGSYSGYVYALNAATGSLKWSYLTGGPTYSSPAIVDGVVYIGSFDGKVYALNANNGALIWAFRAGDQVYSSPAIVNNVVYVVSDSGAVYALNAADGSEIWQANVGSGTDHTDNSPAVANGMVYVGARNGYYAFNATDGSQIWFFASPYSARQVTGYFYSSPAVVGNVVYCCYCDGYTFALNASDGSIVWAYHTGMFVFASPSIANGVVYVASYDGYIYALGTPTGQTPTTTAAPSPQPTVAPTSTPAPTASPDNSTTPITNNTTTAPSAPTPAPSQAPHLISQNQPAKIPVVAAEGYATWSVDWVTLGVVAVALLGLMLALILGFKSRD